MTRIILKNIIPTVVLALSLTSCGEEIHKPIMNKNRTRTENELIQNCKNWYENTKHELFILQFSESTEWDHVFISKGDEGDIAEVPLIIPKGFGLNIENDPTIKYHFRIFFMPQPKNQFEVFTRIIGTRDTTFVNNDSDFNYYHIKPHFNGYEMIVNSKNEPQKFNKYKDGKLEEEISIYLPRNQ
ncbi:hypothetical protein [Gaetbulibacter aestuarii]|uniref:Lipoprotein n=1 Tax=Gaetbulibacter aestuarii TaxID=1502358 RepID=A0ABW7MV12_9FLAO